MKEIREKILKIKDNHAHDISKKTTCIACDKETEVYWDSRYNGYRASCDECGINWSES